MRVVLPTRTTTRRTAVEPNCSCICCAVRSTISTLFSWSASVFLLLTPLASTHPFGYTTTPECSNVTVRSKSFTSWNVDDEAPGGSVHTSVALKAAAEWG